MRDTKFTTKDGIVDLRPTKGTYWVAYTSEVYSESNVLPPPKLQADFISKTNGKSCFRL